MIIPIFASVEKRESNVRRSKKADETSHLDTIYHKETKSVIQLDTPLHLSGRIYTNTDWYVTFADTTINIVRRSYNCYYKCVLTYKSVVSNDVIEISNIEVDETNSIFLFSSRNELGDCAVDYGIEYSYKYNNSKFYI